MIETIEWVAKDGTVIYAKRDTVNDTFVGATMNGIDMEPDQFMRFMKEVMLRRLEEKGQTVESLPANIRRILDKIE